MSASSPKRSSASDRPAEMPPRKLVTITGLPWIATFITSIPAVLRYDPLLNNEDFILGAVHDATFLLGPGFVVGVGNGLILGYLMYTSAPPERESRRRSGPGAGDRRPPIAGPHA